MADDKLGRGTIAVLGATAVAVVVALLGVLNWSGGERTAEGGRPSPAPVPQAAAPAAKPEGPAQAQPPAAPAKATAEGRQAEAPAPSFDIVRVEPNGDSVIAGRAAPGATIELLDGDQVHARAVADASGLFAITPPPFPVGSHQIVLQSIAPDGTRQRSKESVTVAVNGATRPLVALAAPDKPTVLLSNPEPPAAPRDAGDKAAGARPALAEPEKQAAAAPPAPPPAAAPPAQAQPAPRAEIKITSVETEPGRLYVSGQAAPGATVRLYLNETFVAPGGAGTDGRLSFAIASGVKPGDYRVRLDDVDPVSGQVKSRAEVAFNVPVEAVPPAQVVQGQTAQGQAPPAAQGQTAPAQAARPSADQAPAVAPAGPGSRVASALPEAAVPPGTVVVPNIETAIVSRGDSLWRISQRIYGRGIRYTVIYGANQTQIRDPDLIYPGQVFVLPADRAKETN
ncbi:LysM peptidoglycan-binding domain-containing protein [Microvirga thermotolerans]|uniref:LysM peptidoglycan-binding domain-containing protein n=1 Tax=Microvirga thermotolerans TaxID=2651334 RepID=A0A5P9JWP3_9HYPH|nr:LysM peptidoglycan-binding domain-containing protein [Microvirga thermotolerans]QFU17017.1 LysM peptidoglycan-binding domain-containing protein [Microvirga thermotolerans]